MSNVCPVSSRFIISLLKHNSRRVCVMVLCLQLVYFVIKLNKVFGLPARTVVPLPNCKRSVEPPGNVLCSRENTIFNKANLPSLPTNARPLQLAGLLQKNNWKVRKRDRNAVPFCTMNERTEHLRDYCNKTDIGDEKNAKFNASRYGNILVDEKHKVMFCDVRDPISILWTSFLAKATGETIGRRPPVRNKDYMKKLGLRYLDTFGDRQRDVLLRNSFTFLVVRHPMERLVLAWKEKFVERSPKSFWKTKIAKEIIVKYRNEFPELSDIPDNATVRFEEFLYFVFMEHSLADPSWLSYQQVCHPCVIRYDGILHAESMDNELNVIFKHYDDVPRKRSKLNYKPKEHLFIDINTSNNRKRYYDNVGFEVIEVLLEKYKHDLKMFGYAWNLQKRAAYCGIITRSGRICC